MAIASNVGFPRIGAHRELKKALESYWPGKSSEMELLSIGKNLRRENWTLQKALGIDHIPSNDFSLYDHVLDTAYMVGAIPARYQPEAGDVTLATYFAMARGSRDARFSGAAPTSGSGAHAMEMTKWFDTNYHYIVPEFESGQRFRLSSRKAVEEFLEAKALGIITRPVLLGPVSFLLLGKTKTPGFKVMSLLDSLLPIYAEVLQLLKGAGAEWIQLDEPALILELGAEEEAAFIQAYEYLRSSGLRFLIATYFGGLRENLDWVLDLPVSAIHLDLVRAPEQLQEAIQMAPGTLQLSLGLINGRNVWRTDLNRTLALAEQAAQRLGRDRILIAPSCSLLHSPVDLELERNLDSEVLSWLAFAKQKLEEVVVLTRALNEGRTAIQKILDRNRETTERKQHSPRIHNPAIQQRSGRVKPEMFHRKNAYNIREQAQKAALQLPLLPTTTIGSFPQTKEVRALRAEYKSGKRTLESYRAALQKEIQETIRIQEATGLDVLVHGEFERNDMVEFFGEQLSGFATTENGWVQSYGSRCVKPPIIYGDVARLHPMTVDWAKFAQSLTLKPMKGMLTGPVTVLEWSFVRDDQPRESTCRQIALAIRDEVADLEAAGIRVIQIDEPAFREGLPLRRADWKNYLEWAVGSFRLASSGVRDETQIHTHMCYSEFNNIMDAVAAMDADVISIEASRSEMELLRAFAQFRYPNAIGPGVYDIHSPRVPTTEEIENLLKNILQVLPASQVWVNPDCGLKTRRWEEVRPALSAMVEAARHCRQAHKENSSESVQSVPAAKTTR